MENYTRVEGTGKAVIYKGDPRLPGLPDMDTWWNALLGSVQPALSRPHLYGSDAGLCPRKNVFYSQNSWEPFVMQPSTRTYMAIGVALEEMLAQSLREKGLLIASNPYLIEMPEVKVRGKIDLVILDHQDELALVEVKSCGELPIKPNVQHLAQIQSYSAISGITKCYLTYISRKVQEQITWGPNISIRSFLVDCSQDVLLDRLYTVVFSDLCIRERSLPSVKVSFRKTEECRYCPFIAYCWKKEPRYVLEEEENCIEPSPIRELTLLEEIILSDRAKSVSNKLLEELPIRRVTSLKEYLYKEEGLREDIRNKILSL